MATDSHEHPRESSAERAATGHHQGAQPNADRPLLFAALALIVTFMLGEVVVGITAHSLALLSDAAHMLTDAGAIGLALVAMRLAQRPPEGGFTYGLRRAEILSAQANGFTLLLLAVWLTTEGVRRLVDPPPVQGMWVLATALVGVLTNVAATWLISRANRASLNVEGAYRHILTDLFGFIATAVAGVVVLLTGFTRADVVATFVVIILMLKAGIGLVHQSGRVLLEAAPPELSPATIGTEMSTQVGVAEVHDLHIWEIDSGLRAASAHVLVAPGQQCHEIGAALRRRLEADYGITHATLQVDHAEPGAADGEHCHDEHGPTHRSKDTPRTDV